MFYTSVGVLASLSVMFTALMEKVGLFILTKLADPQKAFVKLGEYIEGAAGPRAVDSVQRLSEHFRYSWNKTPVEVKDLVEVDSSNDLEERGLFGNKNYKYYVIAAIILIGAGSLIYSNWDSITNYTDTIFDKKGKGPELPRTEFKEPGSSTQPPLNEGIQSKTTEGVASTLVYKGLHNSSNSNGIQNTSSPFIQFYDKVTDLKTKVFAYSIFHSNSNSAQELVDDGLIDNLSPQGSPSLRDLFLKDRSGNSTITPNTPKYSNNITPTLSPDITITDNQTNVIPPINLDEPTDNVITNVDVPGLEAQVNSLIGAYKQIIPQNLPEADRYSKQLTRCFNLLTDDVRPDVKANIEHYSKRLEDFKNTGMNSVEFLNLTLADMRNKISAGLPLPQGFFAINS